MKKIFIVLGALLIISSFGFAQTASGKIVGKAVDADGVALPGVTVTLTGEKIGKMMAVTSEEGNFRFLGLPVGKNYTVRCELPGFKTELREGIDIWIGVTSEVSIVMEQVAIEETITVIARSSLIDTKSTTVARNIAADTIQQLPTSRNPWTVLMLAPGILIDREDVGGNESGQQSYYSGHGGLQEDSTWRVDGANITDASAIGAAPAYLNMNAYEELQIAYGSNDITAQTGGVQLNFVTKRAGNAFSGMFHLYVEDENWQTENIGKQPAEDIQEGYVSPGINRLYMYGADFGGPILRDHLFFYGSWNIQDINARTIVGGEDKTWLVSGYGKINWQYGNNMGDVFISYDSKLKWGRPWLGAASQAPGTLWDQTGPGYLFRFADQHVLGDLLLQFKAIYTDGGFFLNPGGNEVIGDRAEGEDWWVYYRPSQYWDGSIIDYGTNRNQLNVLLYGNYFAEDVLGGDHEIKFGVDFVNADTTSYTYYPNERILYRYTDFGYDFDVLEFNTTMKFDVNFKRYSAFISDAATFGRLTLGLGLRYDQEQGAHNEASVSGITLDGTPAYADYLGALSAPARAIDAKWKVFSPRLSLAYDLTGDGKNVVKLALARYGSQMGNYTAQFLWTVGVRYIAVPWVDANGNGGPDIGEFTEVPPADALWYGGFDRTDPYATESSNRFDPDYNSPLTDELTLTYEREITSDFAASLSLFYKKRHRLVRDVGIMADGSLETDDNWYLAGEDPNLGQPYYERHEIPIATYRTNGEKSYTRYLAASLVLKKRFSQKWMMDASFTYADWRQFNDKSEWNYIFNSATDPLITTSYGGFDLTNFDYYNEGVVAPEASGSGLSDIFVNSRWMVKIAGLYQLPFEINLSAVFQAREGYVVPYYADFDRGSGIGATDMFEGGKKFGDDRLPAFWILNLGLEKVISIWEKARVAFHIDAYNVTNNATILKKNPLITGTTDQIQRMLNPTVFQFGIRFEF